VQGLEGTPVVVTGAGGFIGAHLCEALVAAGADVRGLVRYNSRGDVGALALLPTEVQKEIDVVYGDVRDSESAASAVAGRSFVYHLAAQIAIPYSYVNPRDHVETNVLGTLNVAQACLAAGVSRLVQTSTSEVYGSAQTVPITEDHPLVGQSPYAASKIGADQLVLSYHRSFQLPAVILRPYNTFGPFQSARAIVPTIVSQAVTRPVLRLGSLDPRRDLTFVGDTAAGFIAASLAPGVDGATVQLGTGRDVSIGELVELVGKLLGRALEVELDAARVRPEGSEVQRLISDPSRALALLGWSPEVGLEEGLRRTIAWIERNPSFFTPERYAI